MKNPLSSLKRSINIFGIKHTIWRVYIRVVFFIVKKIFRRKLAVRKIHGSKMILDLEHKGISEALYLEGTREELDVEIVKRSVTPDMTVLEVGANIGYYLLLEAKLLQRKGRIIAFEPDPRNVSLLKANIRLNGCENLVELHSCAVSDKNDKATFYLSDFSNLSSMIQRKASDRGVEVKTVRIDDIDGIKSVDFIRMDIEGFEVEAIRGMMGLLERSNAKILIELHKPVYTKERHFINTAQELFKLGYRVNYIVSSGEHSPSFITNKGYKPIEISYDMARSHGLYKDISNEDFIDLLKHPQKLIRSVLIGR